MSCQKQLIYVHPVCTLNHKNQTARSYNSAKRIFVMWQSQWHLIVCFSDHYDGPIVHLSNIGIVYIYVETPTANLELQTLAW